MYTPLLAAFYQPTSTEKCRCRLWKLEYCYLAVLKIWALCLSDSHVFSVFYASASWVLGLQVWTTTTLAVNLFWNFILVTLECIKVCFLVAVVETKEKFLLCWKTCPAESSGTCCVYPCSSVLGVSLWSKVIRYNDLQMAGKGRLH